MLLIPTTARAAPPARYWLLLALTLAAVKLIVALIDPTLRFFLGDSESYLHSALTGWVPPDRSYLYGRFIALSSLPLGSLHGLLVAQSICGVLSCLLLARIATVHLGADRRLAAVLAVLLALEPAQLFYERMVMAESLGTLCLLGMLACGFAYVQRQWWPWLLALALAGIATVALRMSLLPVVLGFSVLPPLVCLVRAEARLQWRRSLIHLLIVLAATLLFHNAYQYWYGRMSEGPRAYLQSSGTFRLGLVAPLVKPEHLAAAGLAPELLQQVKPALDDPRMREAQLWMDGGLIAVLRAASGDQNQTEANAHVIASRALRDDPLGLVRLGWLTTQDYFDAVQTGARLQDDLGVRPLSEGIAQPLRERLGYEASGVHERRNLIARWFERGAYWLVVALFALAPLAVLALLRSRPQRRSAALLLCLTALGMVAGQLLFSHIVSFRYLHPFAPVLLLCLAGVLSPGPRRSGRQSLH